MLAAPALADRLSFDVNSAQALRAQARAGDPEATLAAARQFEAMFLQIMLKTMRETRFSAEGDAFGDSSSLRLYQELLDQQWAQKMVNGRGLGFAEMIVGRLGVEAAGKLMPEGGAAAGEGAEAAPPAPLQAPQARHDPAASAAAADPDGQASSGTLPAADRKRRFIEAMLPHTRAAEASTGVPARFILAHAALESGWGARQILAEDGSPSHNLFGIKAGRGWSGASVETLTTEYRQGLAVKVSERFRAYADYTQAFEDYAGLLRRRYGEAAGAGEDAAGFAGGLAEGGYATDPAYAGKLLAVIRTIEQATA